MQWIQVSLATTPLAVPCVSDLLLSYGLQGLQIEDPTDFTAFLIDPPVRMNGLSTTLLAEQVQRDPAQASIVFYLPETLQGIETITAIRGHLARLGQDVSDIPLGTLALTQQTLNQQDWDTAWKQYYHPIEIGERVLICPSWEDCSPAPGQVKVLLDPGMAFGTGTHETTRLCLALLEKEISPECTLLDIGTGSGILAITALLMGAQQATAVDIDPLAVKIAEENAVLNGVADRLTLRCGDLTEQVQERFPIVCANIVADVILRLCSVVSQLLTPNGVLLVSGIIADRVEQVIQGFRREGFTLVATKEDHDWFALKFCLTSCYEPT